MTRTGFANYLLDLAYLHAHGKIKFKRPRFYRGWVKRVVGDTTMWIDVRPST